MADAPTTRPEQRPKGPPPRRPRKPQAPKDHTRERALAIAGVSGLLVVLIVSIAMIAGASGDDDGSASSAAATATATATAEPTSTPEPTPTPVPLTSAERAERKAAAEVVDSRGFEVVRLRDWDPRDTLKVLIGRTSSGGHLAFFFVNGQYLGNDSTETSARLRVRRTGDLATTLTYTTFEPGDKPGKPTGDKVNVRFDWDGTSLTPDAELPPPEERTPGRQPG